MALDNPAFSRNSAFSSQGAVAAAQDVSAQQLQEMYNQPATPPAGETMAIETTLQKAAVSFGLLLVGAALGWVTTQSMPFLWIGAGIVALEPAIAPHLAAREAGVALTVQSLLAPMREILAMNADFTLIEGAGGWRVPLADQDNLSDLAIALKLPVILVVGVRLGCISHALLTAEAIARDGLQLAGWVANIIDPKTSRLEENLATLAERIPAPCLGRVPKLKAVSAEAVADHLQLDLLD